MNIRKVPKGISFGVGALLLLVLAAVGAFLYHITRCPEWETCRTVAPCGDYMAVALDGDCNVTTPISHTVALVTLDERGTRTDLAVFAHASCNAQEGGVNVSWQDDETLVISYLKAGIVNVLQETTRVRGKTVRVVLRPGVSSPRACGPGGPPGSPSP